MIGKKKLKHIEEKILDVDAGMQGTLKFKDPVNLRINGRFEGHLETRGNLVIGETSSVEADIIGEAIEIAGSVKGDISAKRELRLLSSAHVAGKIETPSLLIEKGALFNGTVAMIEGAAIAKDVMDINEAASYLEMEVSEVREWAEAGKLPAFKEDNIWKFKKQEIDSWASSERV